MVQFAVKFYENNSSLPVKFTEMTSEFTANLGEVMVVEKEIAHHDKLFNRELPDQHPIEAITGLQETLDNKQPKGDYLTQHQSLDGYAKEDWVNKQGFLKEHQSLDGYATEKWVEDKKYLTQHQSLVDYAKKTDIPKTLPASDVYSWAKQPTKPTYTYSEVGADKAGSADSALTNAKKYTDQQIGAIPTPDVSGQINTHNTNTQAHNDIRLVLQSLITKVNDLLDSDDDTLDQMSEIVEYIKDNRGLIESVTTSKVNVTDIIDNLETNVGNKPLSAAQGVVLKALIDAIKVPTKVSELENDKEYLTEHQSLEGYAKKSELPTKVSELENDSEFINQSVVEEIISNEIENGDFKGEDGKAGIVISETEPTPYETGEYPIWLNPNGEQTDSLATMQDIEDVRKEIPTVPTNISAFNNDKGYLTSLGADYILESGTSNGWRYEKWNSGKYICWGTFSDTRSSYTTVNGFYGYYSSDFRYPITFPEPPIIHFNCKIGSGFGAPAGDVLRSSSVARCYALGTASGEVACVWEIYVVGRWK